MLLKLIILSILFSLINAQSTYTDNIAVNIGIFSADQGPFLATVSPFSFLPQSREQSLTYCAEHDALNSIDQQYEFCFGEVQSSLSRKDVSKADPEAAVLGAFVTAYSNHTQERLQSNSNNKFLTPSQQQTILDALETFKQNQLNMIREHGAKEKRIQDGYALGVAAAKNILEARWNDGWNAIVPVPTHPVNVPGQWSLNGYGPSGTGAGAFEIYPQWKDRQPFIFNSQSEFQVAAPPHLNSTQYLQDVAETKSYGICNGNVPCPNRTPDTIAKSMFWQNGGLEHTNIVLQKLAIQMDLSLHQSVQIYAASALAGDHAMVNNVYNKATHGFWRPFHAIRNTYNIDYGYYPGLAALYDPNWKSNAIPASPAGFTPTNQEYPCGHCEITSAMTQAVALSLGIDTFPGGPITVTYSNPSPQPPAQPQTFTSFSDMQGQVNNGRIFLGVHLRATAINGQNLGKGIAGKAASRVRRVSA